MISPFFDGFYRVVLFIFFLFLGILFLMDGIGGCLMKFMKYSKSLLVLMMILPWFSVPLLGKGDFKRFLPAGLFISLIVRIVNYIAKKRKWWYETLHPKISGVIPFMLGSFLIGSLWILKWTYGNFLDI